MGNEQYTEGELYFLNLSDNPTIEELQQIIGFKLNIKEYQKEWGKPVLKYIRYDITNVKMHVDITNKIEVSCVLIYSNYIKPNGNIAFNAWSSIKTIQKRLKEELTIN